MFLLCDEEGVKTRIAVDFFPHVNSEVYLDRLGAAPLLTFSSTPHDEIRLLVKRLTDIVLAGAALIILTPVMLAIALIIRLTSPGPAIFRQVRCGLNGRTFVFYKFRSMQENAHEMRESLKHLSQRELAMKIPNDPRLTGVGKMAAQIFGGRVAAALERGEGRHVPGGSAARGSRRGGAIPALAAPPSAHASRV